MKTKNTKPIETKTRIDLKPSEDSLIMSITIRDGECNSIKYKIPEREDMKPLMGTISYLIEEVGRAAPRKNINSRLDPHGWVECYFGNDDVLMRYAFDSDETRKALISGMRFIEGELKEIAFNHMSMIFVTD